MLVEADRVFVTSSPISELVWSPRKGLGFKCADYSSAEPKTSLWWSTESFNVIATGPEGNVIEENVNNSILPENILDSPQFVPSTSNIDNIHVTTSPGSIVGVVPAFSTMTPKQNSTNITSGTSGEEIEILPGKDEPSVAEADHEESMPLEEKKPSGSSLGNIERNDDSTVNAVDFFPLEGNAHAKTAGSLSSNPVVMILDCDESKKGSLPMCVEDVGKRDSHPPKLVTGLDLRCNTSRMRESYLQCAGGEHPGIEANEDDVNIHIHPQLTYFHPQEKLRLNSGNASIRQDLSLVQSLAKCGVEVAGNNISKNDTKSESPILKKTSGTSDNEEEKMRRNKGKQKMDEFQEDANLGTNKESCHGSHHLKDDGSHESIKSSNSKEFSTGKRERCLDSESACKKLKQQKESAFPGTLVRQDSSFINWISGLAKTLPCSVQMDMPLALVPKASQSKPKDPCPPFSLDKGVDLPYGIGFQSFIQTLHHARLKTPRILSGEVNDQHNPINSCEFQIPNKPSVSACGRAIHISAKLNLHPPVPLATFRLDQCQTEELPLHAGISSASDFDVEGKSQYIGFNNPSLCNLGSTSSSFHVATMEPRISEAGKPDSVLRRSNLLVISGGNEYRGNFWITRLCRRPSPLSSSGQINQVARSRTEMKLMGGNVFAPNLQNDNASLEGIKCSEDVRITPDDNQNKAVGNEECSPSRPNSPLKGVHLDKKPDAKLNPILPSKRIKKLEPIASVFAKRLDAFKHIRSPNIVNDLVYSGSICFFCGQTGHSMKDCSQVIGTELERYQKNIKSYSGPKDSACLCICCFQLTHWATACPYIAEINSERAEEHVVEYSSLRESHLGEYTGNLVAHTIGVEEVKISDPKIIQKFSGESKYKGKSILSPSVHSKGRGNQIMPVYSFHKTNTSREQACLFDGIKGLRLSRSDIVRLMKTPIPGLDLEGFFLRVRLGKQEETLEGSGYQVACISGVSREKSIGTTKHHIPVDVGGFKCLLDSRFVSNNDFIEEELNAWWSMISRSGARPPTEEELSRKLAERKSFGI